MPRWYDALRQIVGGGTKMSTDEKAALLGVPVPGPTQLLQAGRRHDHRRRRAGGLRRHRRRQQQRRRSTTSSTMGDGGGEMDLALARTAASLEKLAVDTYQTGIDSGLVTTMAIADAATLFQSHHQDHLDALNAVISDAGGEEVTEPNEAVFKALIEPAVDRRQGRGGHRADRLRPRERRRPDLRLRRRRAQHARRCAPRS